MQKGTGAELKRKQRVLRATDFEVCVAAGIRSTHTLRRVYEDQPGVKEETRDAVIRGLEKITRERLAELTSLAG